MLSALILICAAGVTADIHDCTRDNATVVMRLPAEPGNPVACFMHGQAYVAETSIGQSLVDGDIVRIVCTRDVAFNTSVDKPDSD